MIILLIAFIFLNTVSTEANNIQQNTKIIGINEILSVDAYRQYFSVSVIHFKIPNDVQNVSFTFIADTIKKSSFYPLSCTTYNINVYMKQGALPVISPENAKFPETFLNISSRSDIIKLQFLANGTKNYINITSPITGDWFGIVFQEWIPKNDLKISIPEMTAKCKCVLSSYAIVTTIYIDNIDIEIPLNLTFKKEKLLKLHLVNKQFDNLNITCVSLSDTVVNMYLSPNTIPITLSHTYNITLMPNKLISFIINTKLFPKQYILLKSNNDVIINCNFQMEEIISENISVYAPENQLGWKLSSGKRLTFDQHELIKLSSRKSLTFAYILKPSLDLKSPKIVNLTTPLTIFKFNINDVSEIGGTLYLGFTLNPLRNVSATPYTVIICIRRYTFEIPALPNKCVYFNDISNSSLVLNSWNPIGTYENVHIPYPEIGTWYLSVRVFNYSDEFNDNCMECTNLFHTCAQFCEDDYCGMNCLNYADEHLSCNVCNISYKSWVDDEPEQNFNMTSFNASLIFSISVSPCVDETCGPHGDCRLMADNSIVFSTCVCNDDYLGWDCSDDSATSGKLNALIGLLLLTLSNLSFLSSVYVAIKRSYFSEAVTYFFCMCFSTLYHSCDSGNGIYTYCIFPLDLLKFCDFYCGLLSIWVTLIAMADLKHHLKGVFQLSGAILLALGTVYNMEGILVFIIPAFFGVFIFTTSWSLQCYNTRQIYPDKTYLKKYLPIGILCVCIGIICFAFLETNANYRYTHSTWHVLMALSIVMLLPKPSAFKT